MLEIAQFPSEYAHKDCKFISIILSIQINLQEVTT